jgi:hypothetical protein
LQPYGVILEKEELVNWSRELVALRKELRETERLALVSDDYSSMTFGRQYVVIHQALASRKQHKDTITTKSDQKEYRTKKTKQNIQTNNCRHK